MRTEEVCELVVRAAALESCPHDRLSIEAAVAGLCRLRAWLDSREVAAARLMAEVSSFPEKSLADASRSGVRDASRVLERAETVEQVPEFGSSLDAGRVTGGHVDVLSRTLRQVEPEVRDGLIEQAASLLLIAEHATPDEFARTVRAEARRLERSTDGLDRLERQKRAIRFSSFIDKETGMGRWQASWDPETMVRLETKIDNQLQAMFHDRQPDNCPSDLIEKQKYLRALAVLTLLDGHGGRPGRPEVIVVVDHTQSGPDGRPAIDWGLPVELPERVLADVRLRATTHTVVVHDGVVIDGGGELDLGRSSRLPNRAQRRALRGLYATCAIPGCRVRYSRTKLHHVVWWRNGGRTDVTNLIPLCELHHQRVHHDGWLLHLTPNRTLKISLPDGQIMTTGPPSRNAA
ncbi:MAG TPA: DUF222 domain-containing protein [Ilumatobacteraceae bacterium]